MPMGSPSLQPAQGRWLELWPLTAPGRDSGPGLIHSEESGSAACCAWVMMVFYCLSFPPAMVKKEFISFNFSSNCSKSGILTSRSLTIFQAQEI